MIVDRIGRMLLAGVVAIAFFGVTAVHAENSEDMKEILARMRAMEEKMNSQEKEIGALKGKLKQAEAYNAAKPNIHMQIEKAMTSKTGSDKYFHDPNLHGRDIKIGGYVDFTYQANLRAPDTRDNVERVFDRFDDNDFNLHLAKIYFDGTATEQGQAGFRVDLAFGTDANLFESTHNGVSTVSASNTTDNFTLQQAYIDYIIPFHKGIRLKAGKFVTPHGMEVIEAQDNWNATRSFNFGKAIPFTHTGVGFEAQIFDSWMLKGYLTNGWDNIQDNNNGKTLVFHSAYTPVKWITWNLCAAVGNEKPDTHLVGSFAADTGHSDRGEEDTRYLLNTTVLLTPWDNWAFGIEGNFGWEDNANNNAGENDTAGNGTFNPGRQDRLTDAKWWGVAGYMKYSFWKRWYVAVRGEYFNDFSGTRSTYAATGEFDAAARQRIELYSGTLTLNYNVTGPFDIRLEYRYDAASRDAFYAHDLDDTVPNSRQFGQTGGFIDRTQSQDTITLQFLYKW